MARLITCGFEEQLANTGTQWTAFATATATVVTTNPHSGTYHLRVPQSSAGVRRDLIATKTSGTLYCSCYWNPATLPTSGTTTNIMKASSGGGTAGWQLRFVRATAFLELNNSPAAATATGTQAVSVNTWYRCEIRHLLSDTVGEIEARIYLGDSTTLFDTFQITGVDTLPTNIQQLGFSDTAETDGHVWYYDDVRVNDSTGTVQNSWPGPGKIALLTPNADTSVTWTKGGTTPAATNFGGVDDIPGTTATATFDPVDFNEDSGTTNVDQLGLTDLPTGPGFPPSDAVITLLDVFGRHYGGAASQTMVYRLWDEAATTTDGPSIALGNAVWGQSGTGDRLVYDAATPGKTVANVNAFTVGYKGLSGVSAKRVGAVWVNVDWIEASGPTMSTAQRSAGAWSAGVYSPRGTSQPIASGWA